VGGGGNRLDLAGGLEPLAGRLHVPVLDAQLRRDPLPGDMGDVRGRGGTCIRGTVTGRGVVALRRSKAGRGLELKSDGIHVQTSDSERRWEIIKGYVRMDEVDENCERWDNDTVEDTVGDT
jgi:hypothetical protein